MSTPTYTPLSTQPELNLAPGRNGQTILIDAVSEEVATGAGGTDVRRVMMHLSGLPHVRARTQVAAADYLARRPYGVTDEDIAGVLHSGAPASVLYVAPTGSVVVQEGRFGLLGDGWNLPADTPYFTEKGKQRRKLLRTDFVALDAVPGYGYADVLGERFAERMAETTPELLRIGSTQPGGRQFSEVPDYAGPDDHPQIAAVYLMEHGLPGEESVPGCLFLATDIQRSGEPEADAIVNGYFWAPGGHGPLGGDGGLYCESGSFYASDLRRRAGRVAQYRPGALTFADCTRLPSTRAATYRRLLRV